MNRSAPFIGFLFIILFLFVLEAPSQGYILPSEQLIRFMAKNFSRLKTLTLTQTSERETGEGEEGRGFYRSKIWMKSPDLFHSEIIDPQRAGTGPTDHIYRQVLMAGNEKRLRRLLSSLGIDLLEVAFTRIDGVVGYRIGEKGAGAPKIIIEKERFLPLLITYRPPGKIPGETVTIRYKDFRKIDKAWYPFEIIRSSGGATIERNIVDSLQANTDIDPAIFTSAESASPSAAPEEKTVSEEERLRQVIRTFEDKYRPSTPQ